MWVESTVSVWFYDHWEIHQVGEKQFLLYQNYGTKFIQQFPTSYSAMEYAESMMHA